MVGACSCLACQKRTGSVFGVMAFYPDDAVLEGFGNPSHFERPSDSGLGATTHFCPDCGTTVYVRAGFLPGHLAVAVGCFADPGFPEPGFSSWNATKHAWVHFPEHWPASDDQAFS